MLIETCTAECPAGFFAAGLACGIKPSGRPDLALIAANRAVPTAAMFTQNQVRAAPLCISAEHLCASNGCARAILINAGCANAATGEEGRRRAERTVRELARHLQCEPREVLVNSTGVIGVQLPDENIVGAMQNLVQQASSNGLPSAAHAIMTTDTRSKMAQVAMPGFRVAGIAKGAGMIHPNMATMIAVLLTDAALEPAALDDILRRAVDRSFHRISVDGDTSTNDAVFAMASGAAGPQPGELVEQAFAAVALELAIMIVRDGEGASKLIHVRVREAVTPRDALQIAQTVAGSMLVRTAVAGGDPNWGRILAAIGRAGVAIDLSRLRVAVNGVPLFEQGRPAGAPLASRKQAFRCDTVGLEISLGMGDAADEFFTCDLTEGYIQVNAHYTT